MFYIVITGKQSKVWLRRKKERKTPEFIPRVAKAYEVQRENSLIQKELKKNYASYSHILTKQQQTNLLHLSENELIL